MIALDAKILVIEKMIKEAAIDGKTEIIIDSKVADYSICSVLRCKGFTVIENFYDVATSNHNSVKIQW